jgi:hypothetical protein
VGYGGFTVDRARRLKELELENVRRGESGGLEIADRSKFQLLSLRPSVTSLQKDNHRHRGMEAPYSFVWLNDDRPSGLPVRRRTTCGRLCRNWGEISTYKWWVPVRTVIVTDMLGFANLKSPAITVADVVLLRRIHKDQFVLNRPRLND